MPELNSSNGPEQSGTPRHAPQAGKAASRIAPRFPRLQNLSAPHALAAATEAQHFFPATLLGRIVNFETLKSVPCIDNRGVTQHLDLGDISCSNAQLVTPTANIRIITTLPRGMTHADIVSANRHYYHQFHGWWGGAHQALVLAGYLARFGIPSRLVSAAGRQGTEFASLGKKIKHYAIDPIKDSMREELIAFREERKKLGFHSAASVEGREVLAELERNQPDAVRNITGIYDLMPLPHYGAKWALAKFLRAVGKDMAAGDFRSAGRFIGQYFALIPPHTGLNFTIRSESVARKVLFDDTVSREFIEASIKDFDVIYYLNYLKALVLGRKNPCAPDLKCAPDDRLVVHANRDGNYSRETHLDCANAWKAEFEEIPGCHQIFATRSGARNLALAIAKRINTKG